METLPFIGSGLLLRLRAATSLATRRPSSLGSASVSAIGWVNRLRKTGSLAPGQMGGHKPKAISGEHRVWLLQRTKNGDFTLRGLVAELGEHGLKVDYRSMWEFVHAERLSFKKSVGGWRTATSRRRAPASAMGKASEKR